MAEISSNSFVQLSNYITLNKGRIDGIQPDMGVVSDQGVVGVVSSSVRSFFRSYSFIESQISTELQGAGK